MITVDSLSKAFGKGKAKQHVVANLSLHISQGEVFGFLGPNGAGKSTTIKLLLGFLKPDAGTMKIGGKIVGCQEYRNFIGYLPEFPFFYSHLSAQETLNLSGKLSGMSSEQIRTRTEKLLGDLDLSHAVHKRVGGFSKGMKQRLGVANALLHDPEILIFDEPMSGLDPLGRHLIKELIATLKESGKTIFFSSHILSDIEELCDRIAILHKGRLLYEGGVDAFEKEEGQTFESRFIQIIEEAADAMVG